MPFLTFTFPHISNLPNLPVFGLWGKPEHGGKPHWHTEKMQTQTETLSRVLNWGPCCCELTHCATPIHVQ